MSDLVVTVPKYFWREWLAEGDCAGDPPTGEEWGFYSGPHRPKITKGERLYIVSWGRLRGYAPVTRALRVNGRWAVCREGFAVALTVDEPIPGFRGWRKRWWETRDEKPFPKWKTEGVELKP